MRTYAVIGTGALGGYYGARLYAAGLRVRFLLHRDYSYVRDNGLTVESPHGDFSIAAPEIFASAKELIPADVALVCLKTTANHQLPELLPSAVVEGGTVVVMQNGLGIEEEVAAIVPGARVLGGLSFLCSNKVGPGHIRHIGYGQVRFAEYLRTGLPAGVTDLVRTVAGDFERAGLPVVLEENLAVARWMKLVWNIPYNGLSVLKDCTTDVLMADATQSALVEEIMHEVVAVAAACGVVIHERFIQSMLADTLAMAAYKPSMLLDRREGRPLEIEAIYAKPLQEARTRGVECPRIEELYQALRALPPREPA